jgi:hypothetical protein
MQCTNAHKKKRRSRKQTPGKYTDKTREIITSISHCTAIAMQTSHRSLKQYDNGEQRNADFIKLAIRAVN